MAVDKTEANLAEIARHIERMIELLQAHNSPVGDLERTLKDLESANDLPSYKIILSHLRESLGIRFYGDIYLGEDDDAWRKAMHDLHVEINKVLPPPPVPKWAQRFIQSLPK